MAAGTPSCAKSPGSILNGRPRRRIFAKEFLLTTENTKVIIIKLN